MCKITLAAQGHGHRYKGIKEKGDKSSAVEITAGGRRPENICSKYSSDACSGARGVVPHSEGARRQMRR